MVLCMGVVQTARLNSGLMSSFSPSSGLLIASPRHIPRLWFRVEFHGIKHPSSGGWEPATRTSQKICRVSSLVPRPTTFSVAVCVTENGAGLEIEAIVSQ